LLDDKHKNGPGSTSAVESRAPAAPLSPTTGHTIVCGLERLGLRVAEALLQLGENVSIVAKRPSPQLLRRATKAGAKFIDGEPAELSTLPGIDLARARALVLTHNSDLDNLHAALAAREANPNILIVIRLFSSDLGERATELLGKVRTVSASAEAAPHFAAAALGIAMTPTRLVWGRHFAVDEDDGDLAMPIASPRTNRLLESVFRRNGSGGQQIDIGEGQALIPIEPAPLGKPSWGRRYVGLRMGLRAALAVFDRRLAILILAIATLVGTTSTIFHQAGQLGWAEAVLRTVTTAYGNADPTQFPAWVKIFEVGFMFASAGTMAVMFALVTDAVLGHRLTEALGRPPQRLHDHAVVIGLGTVGYRLTQLLLDAGTEVVAADVRPQNRFTPLARRQGVAVLVADGRYRDTLQQLSAKTAKVVAAVSDDDLVNLEAALIAKQMNPRVRLVARLFDPALAARAQRQLGINVCRSVSTLATPAFVAAAMGEGVLSTLERDGRRWLLAELAVQPGSKADGSTVATLEEPGDLRVIAVRDAAGKRWGSAVPDQIRGQTSLLLICSRSGWDRIRAKAG
jgi:Trk K+ transport system NAD-binding subunit